MNTIGQGSYAELKRIITAQGLLDRQPLYYTYKILSILGMLAISVVILFLVSNPWLQMLNAVFLAFIFVQVGLVMHDADHLQIFHSAWKNRVCGIVAGNFLIGVSSGRWTIDHNIHHGSPNKIGVDPGIEVAPLAFSQGQALGKHGITRFTAKYQAYLWLPLLTLYGLHARILDTVLVIRSLLSKRGKYILKDSTMEALLTIAGSIFYFGLIFTLLDAWNAALFVVIHHALGGLYGGTIFATNHKGMPIFNKQMDFLHAQVLTARNIKSNPVIHLWMGGLDYQIEHHLFSTMPRCNLKKARKIVKPYCEKHGIVYYETGFFRSYKEVLQNFYQVSLVLRKPVSTMPNGRQA